MKDSVSATCPLKCHFLSEVTPVKDVHARQCTRPQRQKQDQSEPPWRDDTGNTLRPVLKAAHTHTHALCARVKCVCNCQSVFTVCRQVSPPNNVCFPSPKVWAFFRLTSVSARQLAWVDLSLCLFYLPLCVCVRAHPCCWWSCTTSADSRCTAG